MSLGSERFGDVLHNVVELTICKAFVKSIQAAYKDLEDMSEGDLDVMSDYRRVKKHFPRLREFENYSVEQSGIVRDGVSSDKLLQTLNVKWYLEREIADPNADVGSEWHPVMCQTKGARHLMLECSRRHTSIEHVQQTLFPFYEQFTSNLPVDLRTKYALAPVTAAPRAGPRDLGSFSPVKTRSSSASSANVFECPKTRSAMATIGGFLWYKRQTEAQLRDILEVYKGAGTNKHMITEALFALPVFSNLKPQIQSFYNLKILVRETYTTKQGKLSKDKFHRASVVITRSFDAAAELAGVGEYPGDGKIAQNICDVFTEWITQSGGKTGLVLEHFQELVNLHRQIKRHGDQHEHLLEPDILQDLAEEKKRMRDIFVRIVCLIRYKWVATLVLSKIAEHDKPWRVSLLEACSADFVALRKLACRLFGSLSEVDEAMVSAMIELF